MLHKVLLFCSLFTTFVILAPADLISQPDADELVPTNITTDCVLPDVINRDLRLPWAKQTPVRPQGPARSPSLKVSGSGLDLCRVIPPSHRRDCGSLGITPEQCSARGCCWDNMLGSFVGVPYCFYREGSCSSGAALRRIDCGDLATGRDKCIARGCCWDPSYNDRAWCFYQSNACSVVQARRVNCGSGPQMNEVQCRQKSCCFDGRAQMKCFKPAVF